SSRFDRWRVSPVSSIEKVSAAECMVTATRSHRLLVWRIAGSQADAKKSLGNAGRQSTPAARQLRRIPFLSGEDWISGPSAPPDRILFGHQNLAELRVLVHSC